MSVPIRIADATDTQGVALFFSSVYESRRGPGSAATLGLLESTIAVLFPAADGPTVLVYTVDGDIHGVAAYRIDHQQRRAELVTVQAHDTVRGRSAAQQLLSDTVRRCAEAGAESLVTSVPAADVRARGFLRREGFVVVVGDVAVEGAPDDAAVTYLRPVRQERRPDE